MIKSMIFAIHDILCGLAVCSEICIVFLNHRIFTNLKVFAETPAINTYRFFFGGAR